MEFKKKYGRINRVILVFRKKICIQDIFIYCIEITHMKTNAIYFSSLCAEKLIFGRCFSTHVMNNTVRYIS